MNAEDLVITLKKNMAKLSKSERRRAIESVRDIIRAAMFDDAAGSGYAMERCPRCGSVAIVKKGKSRNGEQRYLCRDCGRTFSGSTDRILGTSKLPPRDLDGLCRVFRPHAPAARVCRPLRRLPQDRLYHAPQAHRVPEGVFSRIPRRAGAGLRTRRDVLPRILQRATIQRAPSPCRERHAIAANRSTSAASLASRSAS